MVVIDGAEHMIKPRQRLRRVRRLALEARAAVADDLTTDRWFRYLLLLAVLTCGFGVWFRVPNFAGPDEYSRLVQPMKVTGRVASDPGFKSLQAAVLDGRALGATFYLFGLVLAPMFLVVVLTGQLDEFVALGDIASRWELWHAAPGWFWTGSILLGRLLTVAFGVGCVYLTYRIGVEFRDRATGRLAALFLSLSIGFIAQTHGLSEDVPALFFILLTLLLAARYTHRGERAIFLAGALTGGLAIVLKLSGGVAAVALGVAYIDHARRAEDTIEGILRRGVVLGGLAVGLVTIYVGIPSVLVGGPDELIGRVTQSVGSKTSRTGGLDAPIAYWFLRQYVRGLGAPLFVAAVIGVVATLGRTVVRRDGPSPLGVLLGTVMLTYALVYARWEFVRLRHLVPTFPVLLIVLSAEISRWHDDGRAKRGLHVALALLLVTSAASVAAAEYAYVTDPRDGATGWLATNAPEDATIEVYENSIADVGVPHGANVSHYPFRENEATNTSSLVLNETAYTEWMLAMPDRTPEYVQLTGSELSYVTPVDPASKQYPKRRQFVQRLEGGEYNYTRVAAFGDQSRPETLRENLIQAALDPDLPGRERYVAIYQRTDAE